MGDQNDALVLQSAKNALVEDVVGDSRVHRREWIVKQVDVSILIDGPRKADPGLLTTRNVDTSLTYDGLPSSREVR